MELCGHSSDHNQNNAIRQDRVFNDLAIIQAHAQLMLRRIAAGKPIDPNDASQRLNSVVAASVRLTALHRAWERED